MKSIVIAVDFDGTCVAHEFPKIGSDIGAIPVLKELVENGHQLILYTMRSNLSKATSTSKKIVHVAGRLLDDAVDWFKSNSIPLHGIQTNPTQHHWTGSPKCYAQIYIDDAALGCPLKYDKAICNRPFVDWQAVRKLLVNKGLIK